MTTMFACPSPTGRNDAQLYLTKGGTLVDRHGRSWGASQMRQMALDTALGAPPGTGTSTRNLGPSDWAANNARHKLGDALEEACSAHGLSDDQHQELRDLVAQRLHGTAQSGGAAATDRGAGARDEDDEIDERVRQYLKGHGLDDDDVEKAIAMARKDREEARDSRPENAVHGGMGGYTSGVSKDAEEAFEKEYPDSANTRRDVYGAPASENFDPDVGRPGYSPKVYRAGLHAAEALSGGGVSRRLSNDAAMSDADLAKEYPGIENVTAGV
jgi:hypothetical protein